MKSQTIDRAFVHSTDSIGVEHLKNMRIYVATHLTSYKTARCHLIE